MAPLTPVTYAQIPGEATIQCASKRPNKELVHRLIVSGFNTIHTHSHNGDEKERPGTLPGVSMTTRREAGQLYPPNYCQSVVRWEGGSRRRLCRVSSTYCLTAGPHRWAAPIKET